MNRLIALISILFILFFLPATLLAQAYTPISGGSAYYCGEFLGTGGIYTLGPSGYKSVSLKKATKAVSKDITYFKERIRTLNRIKSDIRKGKEKGALDKFAILINQINKKGIDGIAPLPATEEERIQAIDNLIGILNLRISLRKAELKALKECDDGKKPPAPSSFSASVITAKNGVDTIVGYLVLTQAKSGKVNWKTRWFCVALPGSTGFSPRLFSTNPCLNGGQAIANCSALAPKGTIGYIATSTTFGFTPSEDSLNDAINRAQERLNQGPVLGRVRGKTGAVGAASTEKDSCS